MLNLDDWKDNVLILGPYLTEPGGVSNYLKILLQELDILCFSTSYFAVGRRRSLSYSTALPAYFCLDILRYGRVLSLLKPNLVHINPSLARKSFLRDFLYMYIAKRMGYKVILFIHGWHENVFRFFGTESKLVTFFLREMLSFPDRIIVLAESFKNTLMEFGVRDSKIEVLPIMIDYAKYSQRYVSRDTSKNYVLFMSNFFKDKGLYELIRAVPLVASTHSVENPVRFILAGDGPELRGANDLVRSLKISDHVRFTGYVTGEAKYGLYKEAALFAFPTSHGEGFPTVIAEAMAAGLPIIATGVGAIAEVIEDGVNGIILSKPDEHEVARAIIHLLKRPRLMRKMGKLNREKAKDYDVSVVCDRLVKIYDEVIA